MPEQWIIRVEGKEYGPADLAMLREWKADGRVLATNEARGEDVDLWSKAAEIPGLFALTPPQSVRSAPTPPARTEPQRSFGKIIGQTLSIYRKGFFQFFCLTLLVIAPSICGQIAGGMIKGEGNVDVDLRTTVAAAFSVSMLLLFFVLWPIYIAGIQLVTAELAAGQRPKFLHILNDALRFWPRVAFLTVFVLVCFAFWTFVPVAVILTLTLGGLSMTSTFLELLLLAFMVWITGRLFVNFLFWQQFAVLEGRDVAESLRESKKLAHSGAGLSWYRRPMWRGVFIASLWFLIVVGINWPVIAPALSWYFQTIATATDPQAVIDTLKNSAKSSGPPNLTIAIVQAILRPLLGIAFVLLYLDGKIDNES